jgi:cysteine-rich repeat protein
MGNSRRLSICLAFVAGYLICSFVAGCGVYDSEVLTEESHDFATGSDSGIDSGVSVSAAEPRGKLRSDRVSRPEVDASAEDASGDDTSIVDTPDSLDADGEEQPSDETTISCSGGECFWSDPDNGDPCRSTGLPDESWRPTETESGDVGDIYVAISRVWIGGSRLDGTPDDEAWRTIGLDLDGICTTNECAEARELDEMDVSCQNNSPQVAFDGELCRDNTFARLQPVAASIPELGGVFGLEETIFNCELHRGSYSTILKISGYNGRSNDEQVRVDVYASGGIASALPPWKCPNDDYTDYPLWRPSIRWLIDQDDLEGDIEEEGTLPDSKAFDDNAFVRNDYLVIRHSDPAVYRLASLKAAFPGWVLKVSNGYSVANIYKDEDGTWKLKDGVLAARISKSDLLMSFREIGLCPQGDAEYFYDAVEQYIDENADLLLSGDIDRDEDCDALSVGIGYEASQITPGPAVTLDPIVDCCLAENADSPRCKIGCGDGIVFGSELCDVAIDEGQPGACPTSCNNDDPCVVSTLVEDGCQTRCRESRPIVELVDGDQCCPAGANANLDSDCIAECGNGVVEPNELCDPVESCPDEASCVPYDACQTTVLSGDAATCTSRCERFEIIECLSGDGCCPNGCHNHNNPALPDYDADCPESGSCGNGLLDEGETCDSTTETVCPVSDSDCDQNIECVQDMLVGDPDSCTARCSSTVIDQPIDGDECCPEGANANTDTDCESECGNGIREPNESCDDGNVEPFDGCSADCQTETDREICSGIVGNETTDSCRECMCQNCTDRALDCFANYSPEENQACVDVIQCGNDTCCEAEQCYCGTQDVLVCLVFGGDGPCKEQINQAADTTSVIDVSNRVNNINYPIGRATALVSCIESSCSSECLYCE